MLVQQQLQSSMDPILGKIWMIQLYVALPLAYLNLREFMRLIQNYTINLEPFSNEINK